MVKAGAKKGTKSKKLNMDKFLFDNIRIMMFLLVLIIILMLLSYSNTQTIVDNTIAGEIKGGIAAGCSDSDGTSYYVFGYVDYAGSRYYDEFSDVVTLVYLIC